MAILTSNHKEIMKNILYAVETGGQRYGYQRYDDFTEAGANTPNEKAITIGAGQWYATEARKLLSKIRQADAKLFYALDLEGVSDDIDNADWGTYSVKKRFKQG